MDKNKRNKLILIISVVLIALTIIGIFIFKNKEFKYEHNPLDNPNAMKDIIVDKNAVYGFSPDSNSERLGMYAIDCDWSDKEFVKEARKERIAYHESLQSLFDLYDQMKAEGKDIETIARAISTRRNELRLEAYKDNPLGLIEVKRSNLEKYGNENGPTPDSLYEQCGSWEMVIIKAFSPNVGMDVCLGLYDKYYDEYVKLGIDK